MLDPAQRFDPRQPITVEVVSREPVAQDVVLLVLRSADGADLPAWSPGAHIGLVLQQGLERQYSLCGDPHDLRSWQVAVLREPAGRGGSQFVHDQLQVGDLLTARGPRNHFELVASLRYLFIAGGIGITPIRAMINAADAAGAQWQLLYGGRQRASMAFLDELAGHGKQVRPWPQEELGLLPLAEVLHEPEPGTLIYCCGPEPLLQAVEQACAGWPAHSLHVERFGAPVFTDPQDDASFEVVCDRSGQILQVPGDKTVLEVLVGAGIDVESSCEEGACGTCEVAVLKGRPDHRDVVLDETEKAANDVMMVCVSRSLSPRLVLDI